MESKGSKEPVKKSRPRAIDQSNAAAVSRVTKLFEEWLQDSSGYDEEVWPQLKRALNENHSKSHKLFDE